MLQRFTLGSANAQAPATGTEGQRTGTITQVRSYLPLAGGIAGLLLAAVGELIVESKSTSPLSLVLYLLGVAVFAVSAWRLPVRSADRPRDDPALEQPVPAQRKRVWTMVGGGTGVAFLLNILALAQIRGQLDSPLGLYLWLASLILIIATGFFVAGRQGWSPQWGNGVWPSSRRTWLLLGLAVVVILAVASAARLIALDRIPFGINADEGDRAATSIQILRGYNTESIFDNGWYWISILYFWLLAQLMKIIGIGYAQARVFGAIASIISVATITWLGARHFNLRVGLMAGALLSLLAVSLQFARETSEAGPTATLWAVSVALMLEGARRGKTWAWICAGIAGGFSIYFYPSGRLWAVLALGFCAYLLVHGLGGRRVPILRGSLLAGVAAFMVVGPFLVHTLPPFATQSDIDIFTKRAQETSIFFGDNPTRLNYYDPSWSTAQLLTEQVNRSIGILNQFSDQGGFWPTDRPIMSGLLTLLTLLGIGWTSTRWKDPRFVMLALWFWVGLSGVVVTVETPNVQRLATAVPVLALFPALVLDNVAFRIETLFRGSSPVARRWVGWATAGAAALLVALCILPQYNYYFVTYAAADRWPQPTVQGQVVNSEGPDTLVVTLGRQYHMVNSGWIRLMAPYTPRGGVESPGSDLPLALPADRNLTFMLFPKQPAYLPYVSSIYPGGTAAPVRHPTEGLMFVLYRLTQAQWQASEGATAHLPDGRTVHVARLGLAPGGINSFPITISWTASLSIPAYWNYDFRVANGPATLTIDGRKVLDAPAGSGARARVSLAGGRHYVEFQSSVQAAGQSTKVEMGREGAVDKGQTTPPADWHEIAPEDLYALPSGPQGLFGTAHVQSGDGSAIVEQRLDGALATCCLTDQVHAGGKPYDVTWEGSLNAPTTGVYSMTLFAQGAAELQVGGKSVIKTSATSPDTVGGTVELTSGPHPVTVTYHVADGPGGIEWIWTPPGGETSIVPPSALSPPSGAGVGDPIGEPALGPPGVQSGAPVLNTVP